MAGDDMRDVNAGINAGCKPVFLSAKAPEPTEENIMRFPDLAAFAETLS
jgi:histidinol phosphatase-like enzyme